MPVSPFILAIRQKIGHDLLHLIGVSGVVTNGRGEVLLVCSKDHGRWMPIGGMVEVGEEPADAIVREVREETGIAVTVDRLAGMFDGPRVTYGNGDQTHYVTVVFRCSAVGDGVPVRPTKKIATRVSFPPPLFRPCGTTTGGTSNALWPTPRERSSTSAGRRHRPSTQNR